MSEQKPQKMGIVDFAWYSFGINNRRWLSRFMKKVPYGFPPDYLLKNNLVEVKPDAKDLAVGLVVVGICVGLANLIK